MTPSGALPPCIPTRLSTKSTCGAVTDYGILCAWKTSVTSGAQAATKNCPLRQPTSTAMPDNRTGFIMSARNVTARDLGLICRRILAELGGWVSTGRGLGDFGSWFWNTIAEAIPSVPAVEKVIQSFWYLTISMEVVHSIEKWLVEAPICGDGLLSRTFQRVSVSSAITAMHHLVHGDIVLIRRNETGKDRGSVD